MVHVFSVCMDVQTLQHLTIVAATCDDGSCIAVVYGCTDATACNYYAGANVDDGSCEWTSCASTCTAPDITGLSVSSDT